MQLTNSASRTKHIGKSNGGEHMKLYILRWNPNISSYDEDGFLSDFYDLSRRNSHGAEMNWSIYEPEQLQPGDWFIFCRVGTKHDGIVGLGRFTSKPYLGKSWRRDGKQISYADMIFTMLLKKNANTPWTAKKLEKEFPEIDWHGGHAGIPLSEQIAERMAVKLARYIASLPETNTDAIALRRSDGGRFTLACGLLSNLCPTLLANVRKTQTATNAMNETYMPEYNDQLTVNFSRLKTKAPIESCVRLLEWSGIHPIKDFNVLDTLSPKEATLSIKKKFSWLLALEKKYDSALPDYWIMPKFKARIALFTKDLKATIDFLDHDCDRKQWIAMSECFMELSEQLQSVEFIQALERCAERFPRITVKNRIWECIGEGECMLPWELREQVHPSHYIHVPEGKEYEDDWEWHSENIPHIKTYVFYSQEIDSLTPLLNDFNEKFDIFIDKYEDEVLVPESLNEAIGLCEAFMSEHNQKETAEVAGRLLEALKLAKQNNVKVFFNF